jgi:hypothetical protein
VLEVVAVDELHDQVRDLFVAAEVEDRDDVGVQQARRDEPVAAVTRASPMPARSIRSSDGTPCSSIAQASTARISAAS